MEILLTNYLQLIIINNEKSQVEVDGSTKIPLT